MKTFVFTTLFRFIILAGGWIYLSGFQEDALYSTLGVMNPATNAVATCMSGVDSLSGTLNTKLDTILMQLQQPTTVTTSAISPFATGDAITTGAVKIINNAQ